MNNSTGKMTTCTIYVRSDMDKATITSVEPLRSPRRRVSLRRCRRP
ncbi:MAG: hypothetical protein ACLVGX_00810 [Oscillospiraceae bacterium]